MRHFEVVPQESRVWIHARSSLHPIDSESAGIEGHVDCETLGGGRLNLNVRPTARIEMPLRALTSGNPLQDREMMRRIDARRYPAITGELTDMRSDDGDGVYAVTGDVTFHGVTRSCADQMKLSWASDEQLVLEGEHTFDIREFSLEPPKILMFRVHPDVTVRVRIVARDGN